MGHVERALFVVGDSNSGKSTQLRSLFKDIRFGTEGIVPTNRKIKETYQLSDEIWLYLRLTSPHELNETLEEFFAKCDKKFDRPGRWCFACALALTPRNKITENTSEIITEFRNKYNLERVRVALLSPSDKLGCKEIPRQKSFECEMISKPGGPEIIRINGTRKEENGLRLAKFFDYT